MGVENWSTTAINNATADLPDINWREGQSPGSVNNSARGMMAAVAAFRDTVAVGPASATDNAIARFNLTTGKLIQDSGVTIDDSDLITNDLSLTAVDGASWALARGMRIGANLNVAGTGVGGSANEFGLLIHTNTTGSTAGTAPYEKCGMLVIAQTSDPSTSYDRDTVGIDMRGYISATNTLGRAWGGYSEGRILTGGEGLIYAHEFYTVNNGASQPLANTTTSKYGLHVLAGGTNHSTAGLKFTQDSASPGIGFHTGIYYDPTSCITHAIYSPSLFSLRMTGAMGFGHDTPDRLVHAEVADAGTTSVVYAARFSHVTSGTAAVGLGVGFEFELENASGTNRISGQNYTYWLDATNAAEFAMWRLDLIKNGASELAATIDAYGVITAAGAFNVGANQVVGARDTGWSAMTGTTNESTVYDTATVTLAQLAGRVMAIQAALTTHGLIGA